MPRSKYLLAFAVCLLGAALLGHPGSAAAVTNWGGAIDANWSTVGNWDNGLPIAGADAAINGGTYSPVLDVDAAAGNLLIGTTVGSQLDIPNANSLTLDAALFLGGPAATLSVVNQSAGTEDKKIYFEKLLSFKNTRFSLLLKDKYDLFNEWYYIAIRELLGHYSFKDDFEALARMVTPPILPREARNAIALLEKMKLIARDSRGFYKPTDALVTVGEDWQSIAIANFQKSTIQLAESAIDRFKPDERDISTLTVNMSQKKLHIVKEKIRLLRKEIMEIENMDRDNDTVFQINFQIFPMSRSSRVP